MKDKEIDYQFIEGLNISNSVSKDLVKVIKEIWYLKMVIRKLNEVERKADTRTKIMMGGLIKKAGLDFLHPDRADILYGMLLDGKKRLESEPKVLDEWKEMGRDLVTISKSYGKML